VIAPGKVEALAAFMAERHAVYMRKAYLTAEAEDPGRPLGMSQRMVQAWMNGDSNGIWGLNKLTNDPILQQFRFCNVYRDLDAVTVWIREYIREPFADHPHLWFMLAVARQINWPDTLAELQRGVQPLYQINPMKQNAVVTREETEVYPSWPNKQGFKPEDMTAVLLRRQARGDKVYTGSYMIRAEQHDHYWRHWPKVQYTAEIVLGKLWEAREYWELFLKQGKPNTMQEVWAEFQHPHYTGWGPFMAYQVVVDMRHTRYLRNAPDVNEWAALGPGSTRGLNRLHDRPLKQALRQEQGLQEMLEVRLELAQSGVLAPWVDLPELSDVQNCLCEFDKYERVRLGEGRPRALYVPGRGG
jgi:hypothetical protein